MQTSSMTPSWQEKVSSDNASIIIVPDIHGRDFWKKAVSGSGDKQIVFLGDYLDPYPREGITNEMAWDNFMQIVDFKRLHPDNVHLLLGNHDMGYIDRNISRCRADERMRSRNGAFFTDNLDLFDLAYENTVSGRRYMFTHAGIHRRWYEDCLKRMLPDGAVSADAVNALLHKDEKDLSLYFILSLCSRYRGGDEEAGSLVWADAREYIGGGAMPSMVQVFGHTHMAEPVSIQNQAYCLDCGRVFCIDADGELRCLED